MSKPYAMIQRAERYDIRSKRDIAGYIYLLISGGMIYKYNAHEGRWVDRAYGEHGQGLKVENLPQSCKNAAVRQGIALA